MDDVIESAIPPTASGRRGLLSRSAKAAVAVAVVILMATGAVSAYAYSEHAAREDAAARHAAAARLDSVRTRLALAEDSAIQLETALTALGTAATGLADAGTLRDLTAAIVVVKNETDKPAFSPSAPLSALNDRAADLDAAVTAALATVPAVGMSVKTVGTARLAAAGSASAASAAAAQSALATLSLYLSHNEDPRGVIIRAISAVKAAEASSDAAVAAAAAAAQAAAKSAHYSPRPGAPVCASDVLTCVNQIRVYYGLHPLSPNATLTSSAQACADRMAASGQMTHSAETPGWSGAWGENIARGYASSVSVFNAWMASPGHRANILSPSYTQTGLGHVSAGSWWCQQFGG